MVRNNLILESTSYTALAIGGENKSNGLATNIKIYNNTIYNANTGLVIANANSSSNEIKNNIFYKVNNVVEGDIGNNIIENNFNSDPGFVDPINQNFELKPESPCIDTEILVDAGAKDYNLKVRVVNNIIDIGCLEYENK